jgi:hypothetical protein
MAETVERPKWRARVSSTAPCDALGRLNLIQAPQNAGNESRQGGVCAVAQPTSGLVAELWKSLWIFFASLFTSK